MKKSAIIVDDHASARKALTGLLHQFCPEITVAAEAGCIQDAIPLILDLRPDILFLDIEMPGGTGFDLLRNLTSYDFTLIITTAHHKYAIEAIRFCALDYLLKPVQAAELREAMQRAESSWNNHSVQINILQEKLDNRDTQKRIILPVKDGMKVFRYTDILRMESDSNYTYVFFTNEPSILIAKSLKHFDELLSPYGFFRAHQSHLINLSYVQRYISGRGGKIEMTNGDVVELARSRKKDFFRVLGQPEPDNL